MNKSWYRNNFIKALLVAVFHGALALAAACGVFLLVMADEGIRIWGDKGNTYVESGTFADKMYSFAYQIISGLDAEYLSDSGEMGSTDKVVDLREIYEGTDLTYKNTSGLAYSLEDLQKWAESSWGGGVYDTGKNVITCFTDLEKNEAYYYYFDDFRRMVENGSITFDLDSEQLYGQTKQEVISDLLNQLQYGQFDAYYPSFRSAKDTVRNVEYVEIHSFRGTVLEEKYAPAGAENLLDAVNNSTYWKDRLYDAYDALDKALGTISTLESKKEELKQYQEGDTNLTYLYVDLDEKKVYTNRSDYEDFGKYETSLKEMTQGTSYVISKPKLADCESNLNFDGGTDLQTWQYMVEQESFSEDFIFAAAVDQNFSVWDSMAESNELYNRYARLRVPVSQALIIAVILLLISIVWLTVIAGRRAGDEEIHLNGFDRIYTEIAAAGVFCIWAASVDAFAMVIWRRVEAPRTGLIAAGGLGVYTAAMFLLGYLSLVRRIKAGTLWKNSLLRWCLKIGKKIWAKVREFAELFSRNTSGKIKIVLLAGGFILFQFIVNGMIFQGSASFFIILMAADCGVLIYLIRKADGRDRILEGLKRISGGELQYKIPVDKLAGEEKVMAEYINHIGEGLDAAVENSLKNERMKTELITNVSHDIKTPLTSIINYVDLLKRENFTDPKICGYLDVLEAKAQRLKVLTEDVVEASKASSGAITLEIVDLNFTEMLHQVLGEFEEKFEEKNLTLMTHFTEESMVIRADGQRLWRVLENIFGNVVKYALEGTRVYVQTTPEKGRVVFSLKNISAQPLNISADELTERFIRGDVSRNTEGSGLGLSIAKSLTELQGGDFRLYLDGDLFKVIITFPLKS